jgi:hypothetical protein
VCTAVRASTKAALAASDGASGARAISTARARHTANSPSSSRPCASAAMATADDIQSAGGQPAACQPAHMVVAQSHAAASSPVSVSTRTWRGALTYG